MALTTAGVLVENIIDWVGLPGEDRARQPRAPMPAAYRVAGAFGDSGPERISDQELSLAFEERLAKQKKRKTPRL